MAGEKPASRIISMSSPEFSPRSVSSTCRLVWVAISSHLPGQQSGTKDGVRHLVAKMLAGFMVESEVLSGVDPTQPCLHGRVRETSKVAGHSWQRFGRYIQRNLVAEIIPQNPTC